METERQDPALEATPEGPPPARGPAVPPPEASARPLGPPAASEGSLRASEGPPREPPGAVEDPARGDALAVAFFVALFGASIVSIGYLFRDFWADIILALLFATLARRPFTALARRTGRATAAVLVCLAIVVVVVLPASFLVVSLSGEAASALELARTSVILDRLEQVLFGTGWIAEHLRSASELTGVEITPASVKGLVAGAAGRLAGIVYGVANGLLSNLLAGLFHFMVQIATVFYLLVDGARFRRFAFRLSPLPTAHEVLLLETFGDVGRAILFGNVVGGLIQGVVGGAAMAAVGLPSPILWGTVMTVLALLPLVGISLVVLPAAGYLALTGHPWLALGFLTSLMAMALVVENVVKTRLMGSHMQMHDLLIFMSVIGGISLFGVLGLLYGPLLVALFLTLEELYQSVYKDRVRDPLARSAPTLPERGAPASVAVNPD